MDTNLISWDLATGKSFASVRLSVHPFVCEQYYMKKNPFSFAVNST